MVISLNPEGWSHRRLSDGSRLPALASSLLAAESEIAAGRIALFTPRLCGFGLCCSHTVNRVPIWTVDSPKRASLAFTRHPCSLQPGLSSDSPRLSATIPLLLKHVHFSRCVAPCETTTWMFSTLPIIAGSLTGRENGGQRPPSYQPGAEGEI